MQHTPTSVQCEAEDSSRGSLLVQTMEDVDNVQAHAHLKKSISIPVDY